MRLIAYLVILLTVTITQSTTTTLADELPIRVGMVIYINAIPEHYNLKRKDHDRTVAIATVLQNEDVLTIDCGPSLDFHGT
jgi:hypothetical protein